MKLRNYNIIFWITGILIFSGCKRLSTIPYKPEQTPESWLEIQPFMHIKLGPIDFILVQPSSTIFVYLLGILAIFIGLYILNIMAGQLSRKWWGIALILWGIGALLAGTSYQAFSYEIKCANREICSWTSWWEIFYLLFSASSVGAMVIATSFTSLNEKWRNAMIFYAVLVNTLYAFVVLAGAFLLINFLISFELLLIVTAPNILILFLLNGWRYLKYREKIDNSLLITWIWLGSVIGGYFIYFLLDISSNLWAQGIWFSENDILHLGLISWMLFIGVNLSNKLKDIPKTDENLR